MESASSLLDKQHTVFCNGETQLLSNTPEENGVERKTTEENFHHPGIYLTFGDDAKVVCPYCSYVFYKNNPP